nr:1-phosphofructokinase family hexose kinase [Labedaea rhizosphaerae]
MTVTVNPSLDRTVEVPSLERGAVLRAVAGHLDAGGKGVNVTRALTAHGHASVAVLPVGGPVGRQLVELLVAQDIPVDAVPIAGATRSNVSIVEPDGTVTKINEPGAALTGEEQAFLLAAIRARATGLSAASWVVGAGSLPPGTPTSYYADLTRALPGARVAIDTSGPALVEAVKAGPAVVKPNREELAEAASGDIATLGDVVAAAQALRGLGVGAVLASLGADGAVLVGEHGVWHGEAAAVPRSSVGAGDALLAGFLAADGHGPSALAEGLAWAAAAVSLPGSRMPCPADLRRADVRVHDTPDLARRLGERG